MKRMAAVLAILALGTCGAWASGIGLLSEYWSPADLDSGFGWGGKIKFDIGSYVALEVRGSYFPDLTRDEDMSDIDVTVIRNEVDLIGRVPIGKRGEAYAGGGAGYYLLDAEFSNGQSLDLGDEFGGFGIGGVQFSPVENLGLFAEFKYTIVEGSFDDDEFGSDNKLDLNGFGASVGAMFTW
jgi:hypothetical protein